MARNLKQEFEYGLKALSQVNQGSESGNSVSEVVDSFKRCQHLVEALSLFSINESIDDVSTSDIQYLAVDFLLANSLEKTKVPMQERRPLVDDIYSHYLKYLNLLNLYSILPEFLKNYKLQLQDGSKPQKSDPTSRRAQKIEQFKLEKSLQQRLELKSDEDEEEERKPRIVQLQLYALKAMSSLENLSIEKQILAHTPLESDKVASLEEDSRLRSRDGTETERKYTERLETLNANEPLLSSVGKVNRPFTLVSSRDQIKNKVMGTGQYLPTMTVEEYLEEEYKRGGIIKGGGPSSYKDEEPDEDNIEKADAETYKAREWDEFVEANPKGSGNTLNRG